MKDIRLTWQLRKQVGSRQEADDLAALAGELRRTSLPHLSKEAKNNIAEQLGIHPQHYRIERRLRLATGFAALLVFVVLIQIAPPQSHLYGVKAAFSRLVPWSHQVQTPRHPMSLPVNHPMSPLPVAPLHTDKKVPVPSTHGTTVAPNSTKQDHSDAQKQPDALKRLPEKKDNGVFDKLPEELHDIISQQLLNQTLNYEKL